MSAGITVDLRSATPPYEQIRSQISSLVAVGVLQAGSRLPTVRSLAADLGIAAGTVARAYKELEAAGVVESRRRGGTFIAALPGGTGNGSPGTVPPEVTSAVERYLEAGRKAGLSDGMLLDLVRARLGRERTDGR
ncbi:MULTISPECIES: GntR family transcriptional regulator [unclassified Pseudarthrobacter]|uniref:GntR family transcriptional regulator n=1 Tax=unclassified Pseudarthrobacter TaxID=2647000 RepID=UPI003645ABD5